MNNPKWDREEKLSCIRKWSNNLHIEARRLFKKDKTHGNILFLFDDEKGLISVNPIPQKVEHKELNVSIKK